MWRALRGQALVHPDALTLAVFVAVQIAMPLLVTSMLRHDLAGVADRAVMLDHGRVVHDGSVESLRPAPALGARSLMSHALMPQASR